MALLLWLEMTFFSKKNITQYGKTYIHNSAKTYGILLKWKGFESLGSCSVISEKKKVFVLGMPHGDPIFAQVGLKNSNF